MKKSEIHKRLAIIADNLLTQLHKHRLIVETQYEFDSHGIWHMHDHIEGPAKRYYWWSAVAASCPKFEYDYDVYRIAAEQHNEQLIGKMGYEDAKRGIVEAIPLVDYVAVLRFRESELQRVIDAYEAGQEAGTRPINGNGPKTGISTGADRYSMGLSGTVNASSWKPGSPYADTRGDATTHIRV